MENSKKPKKNPQKMVTGQGTKKLEKLNIFFYEKN